MGLIAKETGGGMTIDPVPSGVHIAVCYGVVDLGTHHDERYKTDKRKIRVMWELPHCRGQFEKDGKQMDLPRAISTQYTLSLGEKANLRKDLESWRGQPFTQDQLNGFDLKVLIGKACQIQVIQKPRRDGNGLYAEVSSIMSLPKGTAVPTLENPSLFFSLDDLDKPELPDMPDWIKKIIMESQEWRKLAGNGQPAQAQAQQPAYDDDWGQPAQKAEQPDPGIDWFWEVICPIPHKGQKRDDYMKKPDTIRSLYERMKDGDEKAQNRLWWFADNFEAKEWTDKNGKTWPVRDQDVKFRRSLDGFKEWHNENPAQETQAPPEVNEDGEPIDFGDDVPF